MLVASMLTSNPGSLSRARAKGDSNPQSARVPVATVILIGDGYGLYVIYAGLVHGQVFGLDKPLDGLLQPTLYAYLRTPVGER